MFPKLNVIAANGEVFAGLSDEERQVLVDAAVATREWAITTNPDDVDAAAEYCANGGRIVLASDADIVALRRATERGVCGARGRRGDGSDDRQDP